MINKKYNYAVVGASRDKNKYGYKVLKDLHDNGYKVFPVNPKGGEILNLKVYSRLQDISFKIDVVIMVVPPKISEMVIKEVKNLGIKMVWMQPGSENEEVIEYCRKNNIECIHNACIMMEKNN